MITTMLIKDGNTLRIPPILIRSFSAAEIKYSYHGGHILRQYK